MVLYSFLQSSPNACGFFYLDFGHVGFKADYTLNLLLDSLPTSVPFATPFCQLSFPLHNISSPLSHCFPQFCLFYAPINVNPVGGGGMQARGGDLMSETIPPVGLLIVRSDPGAPGSGYLTLTDRSLVSIQNCLLSQSLEAF